MHSKSDNMEVMAYDKAVEVIKDLFETLLSRYQIGLETSLRGSDFIFDSVYLLHCKFHKRNFKHGRSYVDSSDLIKSKKETTSPINKMIANDLIMLQQLQ